ncbi:CLUMA_CG000718, isoform A, partial [Clunio marinus]
LWGFLADTKGRRATLIPSLIIAFISTFMSSLANNFWLLLFLRFANGFFISCASSTTFAYLGEFHDNNKRAKVLMIASIIYSIFNVLLPTFAIVTLNQDWSFYVPLIAVTYKPWRLFLLICGLPSLLCALVMIVLIPESPKFAYSQGDEPETLKILRRIYRLNYRKSILLYEVKSIVKDDEFNSRVQARPKGFLNFMWSQSLPFLKGHHLRNIMTASFIQFSVCNAANGFWTFFPEFMNNISTWKESSRDSATICEIYNTLSVHNNQTENVLKCKQNHELSTYAHIYEVVIIYGICYLIMSLLINWTGKLYLIIAIVLPAGISALLLIFIKVPTFSTYLYLVLLLSGLTISVVNASTVELFPTKMRSWAHQQHMLLF